MKKTRYSVHADWLRMIECNIPVLNVSVLQQVLPQGPETVGSQLRHDLRLDYQSWRDARNNYLSMLQSLGDSEKHRERARSKTSIELFHDNWISLVLSDLLRWQEKRIVEASSLWPELLGIRLKDVRTLKALSHKGKPKLLFASFEPEAEYLQKSVGVLSPAEAIARFMREHDDAPRAALVTDGERWTLITALEENPDAFATWYAGDWMREPVLLNAFATLFSLERICALQDSLMDLLERTLKDQENVTDTLGQQVQRAIEVLVQSLDKADEGLGHELLKDIDEKTLYDASLTVMMRIVFILCAEERHLLPLGDPLYDDNYALSHLRQRLRNDVEAVLERRYDAWGRFLALSRVIHQGVHHPNLRMPALGGSIFDPERYPFLEGRKEANAAARPLPIDNRTFLYLLEALQLIEHPTGAEILSYGSLDVEQIGHIYEGLLELKVERTSTVTLRLNANKGAPSPEQKLTELESLMLEGEPLLIKHLRADTNISESKLRKLLNQEPTRDQVAQLHGVCGDPDLAQRILPFINLIKLDAWERPIIYRAGSFMVTTGASRRESGSYYTPRPLAERIVKTTLEPLVYEGPAEGWEKAEWRLKTPEELLKLKICDPAMGSGAFLVQTCRYLSQRLLEAWREAESHGKSITIDGEVVNGLGGAEPLPVKTDARLIEAKRLVAERCLYGVDKNPMAVELAKLSLWLVTLAGGRPFAFLDHCLGCGDSLLGLHRREELDAVAEAAGMFSSLVKDALDDAVALRHKIRHTTIRDIHDVEHQQLELNTAKEKIDVLSLVADILLLSKILKIKSLEIFQEKNLKKSKQASVEKKLAELLPSLSDNHSPLTEKLKEQRNCFWEKLQEDTIDSYKPFHWPLNFPEVADKGGFDAIVGNPPFIGNKLWNQTIGPSALHIAKNILEETPGHIDISVVFHRRAFSLINKNGFYGLISTTNISEGAAKKVGLKQICSEGTIFSAVKSTKWPGSANINISIVHATRKTWKGKIFLNNHQIFKSIKENLTGSDAKGFRKIKDQLDASQGISSAYADQLTLRENNPYLSKIQLEAPNLLTTIINGQDVNSTSLKSFSKFAIDTRDLTLEDIKEKSISAYNFLLSQKTARLRSINSKDSYIKLGWPERWWQSLTNRADFLSRNNDCAHLIICRLTKFPIPRKKQGIIGSDRTVMIADNFEGSHAVCLSSPFQIWISTFTGAKRSSDKSSIELTKESLGAYPLPENRQITGSNVLAEEFDNYLCDMNGVTPAMNAVCDCENVDPKVVRARELIQKIDEVVLKAYGWDDLVLKYEFQDEGIGPRYMLTKELREEILDRLIDLNHQYWKEQNPSAAKKESK